MSQTLHVPHEGRPRSISLRGSLVTPPEKQWLDLKLHDGVVVRPEELERSMEDPPEEVCGEKFDRIFGSMIGLALGDALGAHVEFRPHEFLVDKPVEGLEGGGTWGLRKGQFTDDTSMALCLANSLVIRQDYDPYDQLVRYKWWFRQGYMSSTGKCFDIGRATQQSLVEFERRQKNFAAKYEIPLEDIDFQSDLDTLDQFEVTCSEQGVAGNGALMRLAPVPLFFYKNPVYAVEYSGHSGLITHGDQKAYDACRYYGALIVAAVNGESKEKLLSRDFYEEHKKWFGQRELHEDVLAIAHGSYQKKEGYEAGIRGGGYILKALEAALWAFCYDDNSFRKGVLSAINLGDDTDTTAAIYGQLAGACYGYRGLPKEWVKDVYAKGFIECLSKWIVYEGDRWSPKKLAPATNPSLHAPEPDGRPRRNSIDPHEHRHPKSGDLTNLHDQPSRYYQRDDFKSARDVAGWLSGLGEEYQPYADSFQKKDINGYWLLNQMNEDELVRCEVTNAEHQQVILAGIDELRRRCPKQFHTVHRH